MKRLGFIVIFAATMQATVDAQTLPTGRTTVIPNELRNMVDGNTLSTDNVQLKNNNNFMQIIRMTIKNANSFAVKDIIVVCEFYGASGTKIDTKRVTVYENSAPKSAITVRQLTVGYVHEQSKTYSCNPLGAIMI